MRGLRRTREILLKVEKPSCPEAWKGRGSEENERHKGNKPFTVPYLAEYSSSLKLHMVFAGSINHSFTTGVAF